MLHQLWHPKPGPEEDSDHRAHPPTKWGRPARPKPAPADLTTTEALIERCKTAARIESDYRLAKVLGISKTSITHWRNGRTRPDDLMIIRMARLMHEDPAPIVAAIHAERAQDPESRELWLRIAEQLRATGAVDRLE